MHNEITIVVDDIDNILNGKTTGELESLLKEKLGVQLVAITDGNWMAMKQSDLFLMKALVQKIHEEGNKNLPDIVNDLLKFIEKV